MAVFQDYAPTLYAAGLAVIPLAPGDCVEAGERAGKKPLASGFNTMKRRYPRKAIDRWRERHPDANVGQIPGLHRGRRIIVIDNDDGTRGREAIQARFGKTPGMVDTRRGDHSYYAEPRGYSGQKYDLRKLGLNADWKSGNDIVVAPGSVHKSGFVYAWHECDERVLRELPEIDLRDLLQQTAAAPAPATQAELKARAGFRDASSRLGLNDYLYGRGAHDQDGLIGAGHVWNRSLANRGINPLSDAEVVEIATKVFKDIESRGYQDWNGGPAVAKSDADEINDLLRRGKYGAQAFTMLMVFRAAHGARCGKGETFAITPKAMAQAGTLPGFSRETIEICRKLLLDAGFIKQVSAMKNGNQRKAAQFSLKGFRS